MIVMLVIAVYLAPIVATITALGWFFKHRDHADLREQFEELVAAARNIQARNDFLEAQHVDDQVRIADYLAELDAVTEATRPATNWAELDVDFARVLREAGER